MFDELKLAAKRTRLAIIERELTALRAARKKVDDKERNLTAEAKKIREEIAHELELQKRAADAAAELKTYRKGKKR